MMLLAFSLQYETTVQPTTEMLCHKQPFQSFDKAYIDWVASAHLSLSDLSLTVLHLVSYLDAAGVM